MKKIGIIGGMGPLTTSRFFKELISIASSKFGAIQDLEYPEVYIRSSGLRGFDETGICDHSLVLEQLLESIEYMNMHNIEVIGIPCNSVHIFFDQLQAKSNAKIVHIAEASLLMAEKIESKKIGIVCSESSIKDNYYTDIAKSVGVEICYVDEEVNQKIISNIILNVMSGKIGQIDIDNLNKVMKLLVNEKKCDSIVLGCTELPLVYSETNIKIDFPVPVISSITALANAVVKYSYSS